MPVRYDRLYRSVRELFSSDDRARRLAVARAREKAEQDANRNARPHGGVTRLDGQEGHGRAA